MKIGYSSKSGHVETKNKQTVVVKIMVVVIIITIKLLTTERTQWLEKKETFTWTRNWPGISAKKIFDWKL